LRAAVDRLRDIGEVTAVSRFLRTEAVSERGVAATDPEFRNAAAAVETGLDARGLLAAMLEIEAALGRDRTAGGAAGPRAIDLDLLLFGPAVIDEPGLVVPHPRMHRRRFVLEPLVEIAPNAWHPALRRTAAELLAELVVPA
jgi:2-amino-4-hydroxy-6-hydroxymethyldihydropteridine diphosphokinase